MKGEWGIVQPKGHNNEFTVTVMSVEGCFVNVSLVNTYLMVASTQIKFGKILGSM